MVKFSLSPIVGTAMGRLQPNSFAQSTRKAALFTHGVCSFGTRPEKKKPLGATIGQKRYVAANHGPRIAGIILAAGASLRMGAPKLILPFRGRPLIYGAVTAVADSGLEPAVAVLGAESAPQLIDIFSREPNFMSVQAGDDRVEQSASLKAGIKEVLRVEGQAPVAGVCVLLGDQPLVSAEIVRLLMKSAFMHPGCFIVPRFMGQRGNPVIIPRNFFSLVLALNGDSGARVLFGHPKARVHYQDVEDQAVVFDIDTPEDYDALAQHDRLAGCL